MQSHDDEPAPSRLWRCFKSLMLLVVPVLLVAVNIQPVAIAVGAINHYSMVNSDEYKARMGYWSTIELPSDHEINAIHAALLPTGKLLLIAGSGNDRDNFEAGTFQTLIYDPVTGSSHLVPTPADLFCAGHAFQADGSLLVAGGTLRYEILEGEVTNAGGTMTIKNENPDKAMTLPAGTQRDGLTPADGGTRLIGPTGKVYLTNAEVTVPPASRQPAPKPGDPDVITASEQQVFVMALEAGPDSIVAGFGQYAIEGLAPEDVPNVYGLAQKITLEKQDYQGIRDSYEFDPQSETYVRVGDMAYGRWYATLLRLADGQVMAISGLDQSGVILDGQTEIYNPATQAWTERDDLRQYLPTYPSVFQTEQADRLFYSGSSTGYGPADQGRQPGFWNLSDNSFVPVPGLRDQDMTETSATTWAGPVNRQRLMIVGGGGVGESPDSTARIDYIDLGSANPQYQPGPSLLEPTRYPNVTTLPNDDVFITGGSRDYRGKGDSDILKSYFYHPGSNTLDAAADPSVGHNYHSSALLLPNGQVMTLGSDPLFGDAEGTKSGKFENRLEIFTPPYLYQASGEPVTRPAIIDGPDELLRGTSATYAVGTQPEGEEPNPNGAPNIMGARLISPSAVTHVTDPNARSIDIGAVQNLDGTVTVSTPSDPTIAPSGWYMLFVNNTEGVPSIARWVHVN